MTSPGVATAEDDLLDAQARHAQASARLDDLAADFEQARVQADRLEQELNGAEGVLELAQADFDRARSARRAQIRAAYKQPGADLLRASGAFLLGPDAASALHASAVMTQVANAQSEAAQLMLAAGRQVADNIRNQRDIAAGTAAAMGDLRDLDAVFTQALDVAAEDVARAEAALADAEVVAQQQALAQQFVGITGFAPPPVVRQATIPGGTQAMTCPVGQPNGFIDSWGFPRSGGRSHQGVDIFATYGMPLVAVADGYVRSVYNNRLGGLSIDLIDSLGNRYYYAHLSAAYVVDRQPVTVGQLLGANGNSGNATATPPHLHWQFHPGSGGPVNPFPLAAALCR